MSRLDAEEPAARLQVVMATYSFSIYQEGALDNAYKKQDSYTDSVTPTLERGAMSAAVIAQRRLDKSKSKSPTGAPAPASRSSYPNRVQAATQAAAAHAAAQQAAQAASAAALGPASPPSPAKSQGRSSSDHIGRDVPHPERHGGGVARRVARLGDDDVEAALAARALKGDADDMHSPTSIDDALDAGTPRTRARSAAVHQLKGRVAEARFVGITEVERRVRELAQPAVDEYFADQINEVALKQRKSEAREKVMAEMDADWPHATLDLAFGAFAEAVGAREVARLLLARAEEAEAAAEARLVATLEAVEKGAAAGGGRAGAEAKLVVTLPQVKKRDLAVEVVVVKKHPETSSLASMKKRGSQATTTAARVPAARAKNQSRPSSDYLARGVPPPERLSFEEPPSMKYRHETQVSTGASASTSASKSVGAGSTVCKTSAGSGAPKREAGATKRPVASLASVKRGKATMLPCEAARLRALRGVEPCEAANEAANEAAAVTVQAAERGAAVRRKRAGERDAAACLQVDAREVNDIPQSQSLDERLNDVTMPTTATLSAAGATSFKPSSSAQEEEENAARTSVSVSNGSVKNLTLYPSPVARP